VNTQHIGAAGELLVQYKLLKLGIDSARLSTDAGIDLVVYAPATRTASTVQVKSNFAPKPSGGRGPLSRGWYFPHSCPAQLIALVALDVDRVWIFTTGEACELAQQHSDRGVHQLYWQLEHSNARLVGRIEADMTSYLLEHRATNLFPLLS